MAEKIDKEFYLTRGEYAKRIGKSKGSVIQNMRRGKLVNEYITRNGQYYFRDPQGVRAFKETVHGPMYTPKRRYNRGNHDKANYPNYYRRVNSLVKKGGIVVFDNMLWSGEVLDPKDEDSLAINETAMLIKKNNRLTPVLLPVRDGILIYKKRE